MNKPIVFADFHNQGLFFSLQLLFEKRLGGQLYRPVGEEWFNEGYWKIAEPYKNNPLTINQYLGFNSMPLDRTQPLNNEIENKDGIFYFRDEANETINKGITLNRFKEMKFDIIIASIPEHIEPYKKLIQLYHPQTKFIFHVGNIWWDKIIDFSSIPNLMSATIKYPVPSFCHAIWYHEEFDTEKFKPSSLPPSKEITSFINCLPTTEHAEKWYRLKEELPEYELKSYGGSCDNGVIGKTQEIATIMQNSYFGFHAKKDGDGMGIIFHQWFACGKPIITCLSDYQDKLGGKLLVPNETCLTIDNDSDIPRVAETIKNLPPEKYRWMCQQAYKKFKEVVNFDKEQKDIEVWLEHLN